MKKTLPEDVKLIPGFDNYYCSPLGKIFSVVINVPLKNICILGDVKELSFSMRGKYLRVTLSKNGKYSSYSVHRLVALTFLGKSNLIVNHKDKNKTNNNINNLEYVNNRENMCHHSILNNKTPGVCWNKKQKKWVAQIHLGSFSDITDAKNAYLRAVEKLSIENKYKVA